MIGLIKKNKIIVVVDIIKNVTLNDLIARSIDFLSSLDAEMRGNNIVFTAVGTILVDISLIDFPNAKKAICAGAT